MRRTPHHDNPTKGGGDINRRGKVRIRGWKILGREKHESSEEKHIFGRRKAYSNFKVEARLPSIHLG